MSKGTTISLNGKLYIVGLPKSGRLHSFEMELIKNKNKIPQAIIATISDYTLWHRRMGHAHQHVIKHLGKNTEGGPHQITNTPQGVCEGCEKGKSKRLPFPMSTSRAKWPLNLVHSVTIHMDSFLFFPHLLHSDSYLSCLWLITPTLTPPWLIYPYCTFTIYMARYPLVTLAWSYSNIPEF